MESDAEQYPGPSDVAANLDRFIYRIISHLDDENQIQRLNDLSDFFVDALELVTDTDEFNAALVAAGRADLGITRKADIAPALEPKDMADARFRKFADGFRIYTELEPAGSRPITGDELHGLKRLPKINSRTEYEALRYAGHFPGIGDISKHTVKPAFIRMLVIFPTATKDLVAMMSGTTGKDIDPAFLPELFVAYQLMSHLTDESDTDIATEDEPSPSAGYLLH